jgi:hypothetical protein
MRFLEVSDMAAVTSCVTSSNVMRYSGKKKGRHNAAQLRQSEYVEDAALSLR